ncbi:hypothetical protein AJ78_00181 [Emergomyces pasteurianus Ep9510]|uniref:Protein kinase domain-containing protein n=1 Tax=Emergomyces pasteurianus Ep9510 TaxID=1447872 RepID=A0A1J9PU87_9EURO|nr:hypothetical protein AJ78_00181 [Emergomyces pasteurianus Ep9510]
MEFNNIKPSEIVFKTKLFASDYSVVFLVMVRGQICVLKVPDTDDNSTMVEGHDDTTNQKIRSKVVSHFLGTMEKFDSRSYQPYRKRYEWATFVKCIREIHEAGVQHKDPKPRSMMIAKDDLERVVWIDFDRADTYNIPVTDEQKKSLDYEKEIVRRFWDYLKDDCAPGKFDQAYIFYCI